MSPKKRTRAVSKTTKRQRIRTTANSDTQLAPMRMDVASARLYLSYPNADTEFARSFADLLRARGHHVIMFDEHLALGDRWRYYMDEALALADGLVVLVTKQSLFGRTDRLSSQWIAAEIGAARASSGKFVIPVIFDANTSLPTLLDDLFTKRFDRKEVNRAADAVSESAAKHLARRAKTAELELPRGYQHLAPNVLQLHENVPFHRAVFVMMKFPDIVHMSRAQISLLNKIWTTIRRELEARGLVALRADDRKYHDQLWENVCVYLLGCRFGIAVLEDRVASELNPNIALEYGFMRALDRRVGLFRNAGFQHGRADLSGKLMNEFVIDAKGRLRPETLQAAVAQWLTDMGAGS